MAPALAARVTWIDGTLSLGQSRTHATAIDRPEEAGGSNAGFLGGELFLVGLGGCLASNLIAAMRSRRLDIDALRLSVGSEQGTAPQRFTAITVDVEVAARDAEGNRVVDDELDKLIAIAERGCLISNTIRSAIQLTVRRAKSGSALEAV